MIKMMSEMVFQAVEAIPGYKDPSKVNYTAAFFSGVDTVRVYVTAEQYNELLFVPQFEPVNVIFEYNPGATDIRFVLKYQSVTPRKVSSVSIPENTGTAVTDSKDVKKTA